MSILLGYINTNYLTLLTLATVVVMMFTNRKSHIRGTGKISLMIVTVLLISVAEYLEIWVDLYQKSYRILFFKAMIVYWLYPFLALQFLFLTENVRHRWLITSPLIVDMVLTAVDLTGTGIVYAYDTEHNYHGGPLTLLPMAVELFYVVILVIYSLRYLKKKNQSKGIIVMFMAGSVFVSQILGAMGMSNSYMPAVASLEILTYFFYLSAIQYTELREELSRSEILLERNKSNLLMAQIRPHFVNSNLAVIRSLCYEDTEKAVEMIDHFSTYLRENIRQIDDSRLIPFTSEMESVDNYLFLEKQRFGDRIAVETDLSVTDFEIPPLSVQTIVENAVRHGISMTGRKGTIRIITKKENDEILLSVRDDGCGFDPAAVEFDGSQHVGIRNVKDRIFRLLGGRVDVESKVGEGTVVTFHIPNKLLIN